MADKPKKKSKTKPRVRDVAVPGQAGSRMIGGVSDALSGVTKGMKKKKKKK